MNLKLLRYMTSKWTSLVTSSKEFFMVEQILQWMIFVTGRGILDFTQMTYPIGSMYHIYLQKYLDPMWDSSRWKASSARYSRLAWIIPGISVFQAYTNTFAINELFINDSKVEISHIWTLIRWNLESTDGPVSNIWMFPKIGVPGYPKMDGS